MAGKLTIKEFEENLRKIKERTPVQHDELPGEQSKRVKSLLSDYRAFFEYYFPMYATSACSWFHVWVAHMLLKHTFIRFILTWFRGCAKSVHADLGWPMFLKANDELKCMVLVGQNLEKACILLSDLQAQLQSNQRYINDFGEQFSYGNWEEGRFNTKDGCSFHALGFGQSPRGLRNAGYRPDYIVLDDVDTQELSNNPARVRKAVDWVLDDLMGCFDKGTQRFIVVNNMPFANSIMGTLIAERLKGAVKEQVNRLHKAATAIGAFLYQHKNAWHHLRVNAVDDAGEPSWPEKYTKEYWETIRADKSYRSWMREYMNTPITEGGVFKNDWIKWKKALPLDEYDYLVVYADPSWKASSTSDYKAVVFLGKKGSEWHILKVFVRQCSISTMVKYMYDLYESVDIHRKKPPFNFQIDRPVVVDFWIEANANQDLHLDDFVTEGSLRGYQLPIRADYRTKPDKFSRIETMSPHYERGRVYHNEAEKEDPDMVRAIEHQLAFEQGSKSPDDYMDAVEGGMWHGERRTNTVNFNHRFGKRETKKGLW